MTVTGRKHNMDDIIATVLAVEPMKFIYRGRIAVFSVRVLRDERICIVAEQRPDCGEEEVLLYIFGLKAKDRVFCTSRSQDLYPIEFFSCLKVNITSQSYRNGVVTIKLNASSLMILTSHFGFDFKILCKIILESY